MQTIYLVNQLVFTYMGNVLFVVPLVCILCKYRLFRMISMRYGSGNWIWLIFVCARVWVQVWCAIILYKFKQCSVGELWGDVVCCVRVVSFYNKVSYIYSNDMASFDEFYCQLVVAEFIYRQWWVDTDNWRVQLWWVFVCRVGWWWVIMR